MAGIELRRNYSALEYTLEGHDGKDVSWRNVNGIPLFDVSVLSVTEQRGGVLECRQRPYAGLYEIRIDEESLEEFYSVFYSRYESSALASPLKESVLWRQWHLSALETADSVASILASVTSGSRYNLLSPAVSRLVAISLLDSKSNDHVVPGFDLRFNPRLQPNTTAQLIVGGRWNPDEDRWLEDSLYGTTPPNAETEGMIVTIRNISGQTLTGITARVINRYAIRQEAKGRPISFFDQDIDIPPYSAISPFDSVWAVVQEVESASPLEGKRAQLSISGELWSVFDYSTRELIPSGSLLSALSGQKYVMAEESPVSGMVFGLASEVENGDKALIYRSNGREVFEISSALSGWSKWEILVTTSLASQATTTVTVRAAPDAGIISSMDYGTDALLQVIGLGEEYLPEDEVLTSVLTGDTLEHGTVRIVVPAPGASYDQVRIKFGTTLEHLKITEAWIGIRDGQTGDMLSNPKPVQLTFDGEANLELVGNQEFWSDWVALNIPNSDLILSYHGPLLACETNTAGTFYFGSQAEESSSSIVFGYEIRNQVPDVTSIEMRKRERFYDMIPLICSVPENIAGGSIKYKAITAEYKDSLEEYGITFGVTS